MIYTFEIDGIPMQTGDIICTINGKPDILPGQFWWLVGKLVPGDVDHIAIYLGPDGRCVEAGALGVVTFDIPNGHWDSEKMAAQRGLLFDTLYGIAAPLDGLQLSPGEEMHMRQKIAEYCLSRLGRPYNLNFLDPDKEDAFYCSQLAYKAYLQVGINLNTGLSIEQVPGTNQIIYPQEIWGASAHRIATHIDWHTPAQQDKSHLI